MIVRLLQLTKHSRFMKEILPLAITNHNHTNISCRHLVLHNWYLYMYYHLGSQWCMSSGYVIRKLLFAQAWAVTMWQSCPKICLSPPLHSNLITDHSSPPSICLAPCPASPKGIPNIPPQSLLLTPSPLLLPLPSLLLLPLLPMCQHPQHTDTFNMPQHRQHTDALTHQPPNTLIPSIPVCQNTKHCQTNTPAPPTCQHANALMPSTHALFKSGLATLWLNLNHMVQFSTLTKGNLNRTMRFSSVLNHEPVSKKESIQISLSLAT